MPAILFIRISLETLMLADLGRKKKKILSCNFYQNIPPVRKRSDLLRGFQHLENPPSFQLAKISLGVCTRDQFCSCWTHVLSCRLCSLCAMCITALCPSAELLWIIIADHSRTDWLYQPMTWFQSEIQDRINMFYAVPIFNRLKSSIYIK